MNIKLLRTIYFAINGIYCIQNIFYFINLPNVIAIYFGISGNPDNWKIKETMLLVNLSVQILLNFCFVLFPIMINKIPKIFINIPNKDYWLSDEKIDETKLKLKKLFFEYGVYIFIFLIFVFHLVYIANVNKTRLNLKYFFTNFIIFNLLNIYWIIKTYKVFKINTAKNN